MTMRNYGYQDAELVTREPQKWGAGRWIALFFALLFIGSVWMALDQKLLFGHDWLSETYDNEDWRTNEGNLHTYGAWDIEAHVWKTEYIMKYFPYFQWNPYWYLGMPLLKYYQSGFYTLHWLTIALTGLSPAKAATMLVIVSHLVATLMTFLVCYKVSRRIWVSALCATFLLSNTFISLRSYGWEPITVVFLWLYPLGLMIFLREPLRPFRFWMIIVLGLAYLCHPLLWFSLCMTMGLYLLAIALKHDSSDREGSTTHYIYAYLGLVLCSALVGAVQFIPQMSYNQVTSGAHMGIKYLPFYQVPPNIITLKDFFLDAGNLKGPGPIIMIAFFLLAVFAWIEWRGKSRHRGKNLHEHELVIGLAFTLLMMVLFYYLELYNLFPMNFLRSIQYHRIIPEFIICAAVIVAALSNLAYTAKHKVLYYTMLIAFVAASFIIVYQVQAYWQTTPTINEKPEFLYDQIPGRITMPYTDQSLAVRNSFTEVPQTYGYYEQGITNSYDDEIFSVSSGYHNADLTVLYLTAANVGRIYINLEEGERDRIMRARMNNTLRFVKTNNTRYGYFELPLKNPSFSQAIDGVQATEVQKLEPGCRIIFQEEYCGSVREEFVSTDPTEIAYLRAYVDLLDQPYAARSIMTMEDPHHYRIDVRSADADTAIVVKMTYDKDFSASVDGVDVPVERIGPDFMLIRPNRAGSYTLHLTYHFSPAIVIGAIISIATVLILAVFFLVRRKRTRLKFLSFPPGDMQ